MNYRMINPNWTDPVAVKAAAHKADVQAFLTANPGNRYVTLAELRAALPGIAADLTRPVVAEIARQLGIRTENPDAPDA